MKVKPSAKNVRKVRAGEDGEKLSWRVFPERSSYPAIVSLWASAEVAPLGLVENDLCLHMNPIH